MILIVICRLESTWVQWACHDRWYPYAYMNDMEFSPRGPVCFKIIIGKYFFNIFKNIIVILNILYAKSCSKYIVILVLSVDSNWPGDNEPVIEVIPHTYMDNMGFSPRGPVCFTVIIGKYFFNIIKYVIVILNKLYAKSYSKYIFILVLSVVSNWPADNEPVIHVIPPCLHG